MEESKENKKSEIVKKILDLYIKYGNNKYTIGENITQLEHAIQAAIYADVFVHNTYFLTAILPDYKVTKEELSLINDIKYIIIRKVNCFII